ncbi:MAG: DUF2203 domain-containing protein [Halobacteriales archaeon]|nr:DUF2203 domain-containing protein [Halobacteriales archaeon]
MEPKLFTLDEARALLKDVQPLMEEVREAAQRMRDASAGIAVLVQQHGEGATGVDSATNPDRARYWDLVASGREAEEHLQELLDEAAVIGIEVKDLDQGLVDFRAKRDREVVYLCWKLGEDDIAHWHGLSEGFGGRKPLAQAPAPGSNA